MITVGDVRACATYTHDDRLASYHFPDEFAASQRLLRALAALPDDAVLVPLRNGGKADPLVYAPDIGEWIWDADDDDNYDGVSV